MLATLDAALSVLDFHPVIPCEGTAERLSRVPEHAAQWLIRLSCGCSYALCDRGLAHSIDVTSDTKHIPWCSICDTDYVSIVKIEPIK